jgi:hypothetical protein
VTVPLVDLRLTLRAGWLGGGHPCRVLARPDGPAGFKLIIVRAPLKPTASGADEPGPSKGGARSAG